MQTYRHKRHMAQAHSAEAWESLLGTLHAILSPLALPPPIAFDQIPRAC
jgi:hypothetical protein